MGQEVLVTPAIEIQAVFDREGGRAFTMRFAPLPLDVKRHDLDEALDRVLSAVERQRAKYELADEETKLKEQLGRIRSYESQRIRLEESQKSWWEAEGRKGEWGLDKLSPNHKNERERLMIGLERDRHDATERQARIRRLQERINGDAPDIGADRDAGMPDC